MASFASVRSVHIGDRSVLHMDRFVWLSDSVLLIDRIACS